MPPFRTSPTFAHYSGRVADDLLLEATDLALTLNGVDAAAILSEFRPSARMRQALERQNAVLPETIKAVARVTLGEKRRESRDKRLAAQSANRRQLELIIGSAWQGASK